MDFSVALNSGQGTDEIWPLFGKIDSIFVVSDKVYFKCTYYKAVKKVHALNAFNVVKPKHPTSRMIWAEDLCDPKPYYT